MSFCAKRTKLLKYFYTWRVSSACGPQSEYGNKIAKVLFGIESFCDFLQSFLSFFQTTGFKKIAAERSEMDGLMKEVNSSEAVLFM